MINIEWDSYHPDGRKRTRPPASTIHGWLAKMRGTLIGDEKLRSRGMREMREARAMRKDNKEKGRSGERPRSSKPSYSSSFSLFGSQKKPSRGRRPSRRRADSHRLLTTHMPQGRSGKPAVQRSGHRATRHSTTRRGRPRR